MDPLHYNIWTRKTLQRYNKAIIDLVIFREGVAVVIHGWTQTDIGKVRTNNEDACWFGGEYNWKLALVADGMGGHQAGEVASSQAVRVIREMVQAGTNEVAALCNLKQIIYDAVKKANSIVFDLGQNDSTLTGMGTTVTAALFTEQQIHIAQVGDSRIYLYRQRILNRLTEDHSLVQGLINGGCISMEQARVHPKRHLLTRVVGTNKDVEIDLFIANIRPGDVYLLCTDGLTAELTDEQIEQVLETTSPHKAANTLIEAALDCGGQDNITVAVVYVDGNDQIKVSAR